MENGAQAPLVEPKRNSKARFKDYDALNAEKEAFGVVVGGREIEFPKLMPAKVILDIERERASGGLKGDEAETNFGFRIIEQVIGKANWEHIMAHVSVHQAREIVNDMMAYHGFGGSSEEEDDSVPLETEGSRLPPSSSASPSSTQTSSATGLEPGSAIGAGNSDGASSAPGSEPFPKAAPS